jgi:chemotaxis protein CheX
MKAQILNPFLEAIHEVLSKEVQVNVKRGELSLDARSYTTEDVTALISMIGQVEGNVLLSLSQTTAKQMVGRMLGEEVSEFNELAQSGISELGNVIVGQASVRLARAGYQTNISPPALILGEGAKLSTLDYPRLVVPLATEMGMVTIHLALKESTGTHQPGTQLKTPERPEAG